MHIFIAGQIHVDICLQDPGRSYYFPEGPGCKTDSIKCPPAHCKKAHERGEIYTHKKIRILTSDTWQMKCDMWHVTCYKWYVTDGEMWTFSQNFSSLALTVCEWYVTWDMQHVIDGGRWKSLTISGP